MRTPILSILVWTTVLLLTACVDKPAPWAPDGRVGDNRGDGSAVADGTGAVDGRGTTDTPGQVDQDGNLSDQGSPDLKAVDEVGQDDSGGDQVEAEDTPVPDVPCTPACEGQECGPDGCGGQCGNCTDGKNCVLGYCVLTSGTCDDGNEVNWDGCTAGYKSEFQVNASTLDDQRVAAVAAVGEAFVVVWQSCHWNEWEANTEGHDGWGCGIFARRIFVDDMVMEDEYQVNETIQLNQLAPDVAPLGENIVVSWLSYASEDLQIQLRVFGEAGNPLSAEVPGNAKDHLQEWRPVLATAGNDQILIAWRGIREEGGIGIMGQYFNWDNASSTLESVSDVIEIKLQSTVDTRPPRIATVSYGGFVAAWGAEVGGANYIDVFGQASTYPNSPLVAEFPLFVDGADGAGQDNPDVASAGAAGNFVAVYEDHGVHVFGEAGLAARLFGSDGQPQGAAKPLIMNGPAVSLPNITEENGGTFFMAWGTHHDGDESPWRDDIQVMRLQANLTKEEQTTANLHIADYQKFVRVATNPNTGHSVAVWESCPWDQYNEGLDLPGQDGDGCGIFARVYNSN